VANVAKMAEIEKRINGEASVKNNEIIEAA
jgi:hypothetical protein